MKTKLTIMCVAALMCLMLTSPASAGNIGPNAGGGAGGAGGLYPGCCSGGLYSNGGINGTSDAWTINSGFTVSDTFTLGSGATVSGANIGVWEFPGDSVTSVDFSIGTAEGAGSVFTATATDAFISTNQYGYDIDSVALDFGANSVALGAGTYWLTLQNAVVASGDPVYWDENSGPSQASESSVGTIPSEAFNVTGGGGGGAPEPGTLVLGGSGLLLLAGALRRKLNR